MDIHDIAIILHDQMDGLVRFPPQTLHRRAGAVDHIHIIRNTARKLAQAHARAVNTGLFIAQHIAARAHAGKQAVHGGFMQAGPLRKRGDRHAVPAAAQRFQQIERPVE